MQITDEKLTELVNQTLKKFTNDAGLNESSTKDEIFMAYIALFAGIFFYLIALDGKDIAIKTILGFLVRMIPSTKIDAYFKNLEKHNDR